MDKEALMLALKALKSGETKLRFEAIAALEKLDEHQPEIHSDYCHVCKQKIRKLNPHSMDKSKVALLEFIALQNGEWVKISTGDRRQLVGDAAVLALRLQWFGLVEHGEKRSGLYRATQDGINFLRGIHLVPKIIWCRDSKVVLRDKTMICVNSIKNVVFDRNYWNNYANEQRHLFQINGEVA